MGFKEIATTILVISFVIASLATTVSGAHPKASAVPVPGGNAKWGVNQDNTIGVTWSDPYGYNPKSITGWNPTINPED
jgi:hypothetical protein